MADQVPQTRPALASNTIRGVIVLFISFVIQLAVTLGYVGTDEAAMLNGQVIQIVSLGGDLIGLILVIVGRFNSAIKPLADPPADSADSGDGGGFPTLKSLVILGLLGGAALGLTACMWPGGVGLGPDGQAVAADPVEQKKAALISAETAFTRAVEEFNFLKRAGKITAAQYAQALPVVLTVNGLFDKAHQALAVGGDPAAVDGLLAAAQDGIRRLILINQQAEKP